MDLLHRAIDACDKSFIFDNSEAFALRLVMEIANPPDADRKSARIFHPVPDWARRYVIERVELTDVEGQPIR